MVGKEYCGNWLTKQQRLNSLQLSTILRKRTKKIHMYVLVLFIGSLLLFTLHCQGGTRIRHAIYRLRSSTRKANELVTKGRLCSFRCMLQRVLPERGSLFTQCIAQVMTDEEDETDVGEGDQASSGGSTPGNSNASSSSSSSNGNGSKSKEKDNTNNSDNKGTCSFLHTGHTLIPFTP